VQDRILQETIERERIASYYTTVHTGRMLVGVLRGTDLRFVGRLEEELALAIFGTIFNPEEIERRLQDLQRESRMRREVALRDARLLERVASFTEEEDNTEQQRRAAAFEQRLQARRRAARKGIDKPWQKDE
jgi:hypothetical protein